MECQSYRYAEMRQLRDGHVDNQCQSHLFVRPLHHAYAQSNVVHVKQGDEFILDLATLIVIRNHSFKQLIDPQLLMTN